MDDFSSMRYAHSDGHTDICFDESGTQLITGGTDGDIRIWNGFDDDDPQSQNMGKTVTAIALKNKMLYVATDAFSVSSYTLPEVEFDSIIAQYNSEVYHIVCNVDGNLIASGGGDFLIKVYDSSNKSLVAFRGHNAPVLSLVFDPENKFLASTSCDGNFCVWQLSNQECLKTLNILKKSNDWSIASSLSRLSWSPDGQFVAVPVENEIHLYKRDLWECTFKLKDESLVQNASIAAFSPYGNYIAAATVDGQIVVWDVEKKSSVSQKSHEKKVAVCGLVWNPSGKDIVFCDVEGQLGVYEKPLTSTQDQISRVEKMDVPIDFECDDDGNDEKNLFDDDDNDGKNLSDADANDLDLLHDDDGDNDFDIGAIKATLEPKIFGKDDDEAEENESVKSEKVEPKIQVIEAPKPLVQTAFQPSATPVHLERRFMLWNNVGIVRCYNTEEENSVDVEFHDVNIYHPLHLNNTRNHTLAALSTQALLLASPKMDENSSKLECLHFGTWDSNKEWIIDMPENEDIESIALGEGFAICVTDQRLLRIFTISGVQCEVISIPGPVVCCAAKDKQVIVAYHRGLGIENDQCLNLMVIDVKLGGHCVINNYPLPLSPKSFLSWLGHTDEGHPCVVDTSGIVNILNTRFGFKWIPVANTKSNLKGKSDTYFVLGLTEIKQEIRCILCKGARYPSLLPRPTVAVVQFSLPFCEMSSDKGRLEEENRRCSMTHKRLESLIKEGYDLDTEYSTIEKKWMDILLKMFALATRTDREYRALDIAELMPNTVVIQGAIKYATQRHRFALAERLGDIMNKKLLAVEEEEDDDPLPEYDSFSLSQDANHSKLRLNTTQDDETILKPKPLSRSKYDSPRTSENSEMLSVSDLKPKSDYPENDFQPKASPISNPFKSSSKLKSAAKDENCSSSIDTLLDNSMKNLHNKTNTTSSSPPVKPIKKTKSQEQKTEGQTKLSTFQPEQPKKYGFQLFLEQNKDTIICSSENEMNEEEIVKVAMKMFKELPKEEKQKFLKQKDKEDKPNGSNGVYSNKAEENDSSVDTSSEDTNKENNSKRKVNSEVEEEIPKPKKLKSQSSKLADTTVRKLTQFAFTKTKPTK